MSLAFSYVLNNPLSYTDPSGFFFKKLVRGYMRVTGSWAVHKFLLRNRALNTLAHITVAALSGPLGSAWFTYAQTFVATGSLNAATRAGAIAYGSGRAFEAIGAQYEGLSGPMAEVGQSLLHGMVGGVSTALSGGQFGHGFLAAGVTKAVNVNSIYGMQGGIGHTIARITIAALIGGTVSKLTGGKFANGAMTAAIAQALNGEGEVSAYNEQ